VVPGDLLTTARAPEGHQLLKSRTLLLIALCFSCVGVARAEDWSAWQRAYDPATRTRFIPVELWTGAAWDGTQEIRMAPAALEFGWRGDKSIKGPTTWNGIQVYERLNRDKLVDVQGTSSVG
jgi:hypothetical protein